MATKTEQRIPSRWTALGINSNVEPPEGTPMPAGVAEAASESRRLRAQVFACAQQLKEARQKLEHARILDKQAFAVAAAGGDPTPRLAEPAVAEQVRGCERVYEGAVGAHVEAQRKLADRIRWAIEDGWQHDADQVVAETAAKALATLDQLGLALDALEDARTLASGLQDFPEAGSLISVTLGVSQQDREFRNGERQRIIANEREQGWDPSVPRHADHLIGALTRLIDRLPSR